MFKRFPFSKRSLSTGNLPAKVQTTRNRASRSASILVKDVTLSPERDRSGSASSPGPGARGGSRVTGRDGLHWSRSAKHAKPGRASRVPDFVGIDINGQRAHSGGAHGAVQEVCSLVDNFSLSCHGSCTATGRAFPGSGAAQVSHQKAGEFFSLFCGNRSHTFRPLCTRGLSKVYVKVIRSVVLSMLS